MMKIESMVASRLEVNFVRGNIYPMDKIDIKNLIFIDCEANGKCPSMGKLTEFGAVAYPSRATFHGVIIEGHRSAENPTTRIYTGKVFSEK